MRKVVKKTYKYAAIAAAVAVSAALSSCSSDGEGDFRNVVEIADESDSSLPKATEVGSNTAGAYFDVRFPSSSNRLLWTMNYPTTGGYRAAEIRVNNWWLTLDIEGHIKGSSSEIVNMAFTLPNVLVDSLTGLLALSNSSFRTSDGKLSATVTSPWNLINFTYGNPISVTDATLSFTKCKQIYKDQQFYGVSVSGKFTMRGTAADTISVTVDNGRFDLLFKSHINGIFQ